MMASVVNGFGQIKYALIGLNCMEISYNFYLMYLTTMSKTMVLWVVYIYNIAFLDEIGYFQYCTSIDLSMGSCNGFEGFLGNQ